MHEALVSPYNLPWLQQEGWAGLTSRFVFLGKEVNGLSFLKVEIELVAMEATVNRGRGRLVGYR